MNDESKQPDPPSTEIELPAEQSTQRHSMTGLLLGLSVLTCIASLCVFGWAALQLIWSERWEDAAFKLLLSGATGFVGGVMMIMVVRLAR